MSTKIYVDAWNEEHGCSTRGEIKINVNCGLIEVMTDSTILFDVDPYHARKLADLLHTLCGSMEAE